MSKVTLNNIPVLLITLYTVAVICWVVNDNGFYGVRFLSIWSLLAMWIVNLYSIYLRIKFKNKPCKEWLYYKKIKFKIFLGMFFLVPLVTELPQKLSILFFYNIEESYKRAEIYEIKIKGYFKTGTSKQGGDTWASAKNIDDERINYVLICNLISMVKCDLGDLKGGQAIVKLSQENIYPLSDMSVVYSFKSKTFNFGESKFIDLYKENKKFIFYFLFFIYIPSICFSLIFMKF